MSQSLTPPPFADIAQQPLVGIDAVIRIIQDQLATLPWLEQSLGRVMPQRVEGKIEPWIYKAGHEYYPAFPNDTMESFSCCYAHDDEKVINEFFVRRSLSVIVWANLDLIPGKPRTVEGLKLETIRQLRELECVYAVMNSIDQTASGPNGIYPGFDLGKLESQYLTLPYGGFRVVTTVHFTNVC